MSVKLSNMMHSSNSVITLLATLRCKPDDESLQVLQVYLRLCHRINTRRQIFAHNLKEKQATTLHFTCFLFSSETSDRMNTMTLFLKANVANTG